MATEVRSPSKTKIVLILTFNLVRGNILATNHAQQKITTQQVLSFIQSKIAETHAAGEDILSLLGNPEIAFSLQILDGKYDNLKQAPVNQVAEENKKSGTEQLFMTTDANTNIGASQTTGLLF